MGVHGTPVRVRAVELLVGAIRIHPRRDDDTVFVRRAAGLAEQAAVPKPPRERWGGTRHLGCPAVHTATGRCLPMNAGSMSTPSPGPVGTLIFPPTTLSGDVLHSKGTPVCSPLNSWWAPAFGSTDTR